jgi:hypothetical protein
MVRLLITASGQLIHETKLDRQHLTPSTVLQELRENITDFDTIFRFWHFPPEFVQEQPDGSLLIDLYYRRDMELILAQEPKLQDRGPLKRGEKPSPLIWYPPLIERRDTGTSRGMGLFALHRIKAGVYITEYGGKILTHEQASALDPCDKTHLLPMYQNGPVFDGRIRGAYTFEWYESQGLLAQFANDKRGTGKPGNVDYKGQAGDFPGGEHRTPKGGVVIVPVRKFIVATRTIAPGEELLLLNYGPGHQKFEEECEERRRAEARE